MAGQRPEVNPETVELLAALAGIPLRPGRAAELVSFVRDVLAGAARLEHVDASRFEPPIGPWPFAPIPTGTGQPRGD